MTDPLQRFEADRPHLRAVAYRMLGSLSDADDAVQEAWLRLQRSDVDGVANLTGWLTTVVGRVCLDILRSRAARREEPLELHLPDPVIVADNGVEPEHAAVLADSVGLALLVVLETLAPAERLAFVLHDLFGVPFDEVGRLVGRSSDAAKMMASRARHRVRGEAPKPDADPGRHRAVVDAFLAASRGGDFDALVALLDPDVVLRAESAGRGVETVRGGAEVAGRALLYSRFSTASVERVLVNGTAGLLSVQDGRPAGLLAVTVVNGLIVEIDVIADPERLARLL
ncbi:MAG TPA: sigma-70 family RNA polymerase sigma factor [Pseudonocardia sp.]